MALVPPTNLLAAQTVSSSFDQLLYIDDNSGLEEATLRTVSTESAKSALQLCGEKVLVISAETDQVAAFDVQQADTTSIFKVNASSVGTTTIGTVTVGVAGTGHDVLFYGDTSGKHLLWDQSAMELALINATKLSFWDAEGGENIVATSDGHLEINAGTTLDITAPTVDLNSATEFNIDTAIFDLNASGEVAINGAAFGVVGTTIDIDGTGAMQINSSGGTIGIGNDDIDQNINIGTQGERTINIGTGSFADQVVIGNTTGASGVKLLAGTGDVEIEGNLGIGVAAPDDLLHVEGTNPYIRVKASNEGGSAHLYLISDQADDNHDFRVLEQNAAGSLNFNGYGTGSWVTHMTILEAGNVGIGVAVPVSPLHVYDDTSSGYVAFFHNDGNNVDRYGIKISCGTDDGSTDSETTYISADDGDGHGIGSLGHNTSGNFVINETSDARLKNNIIDTKIVGLDIVNAIKVREFNWIRKGGLKDPAGLIAQEVASVYPRAVSGSPDGDTKTAPMMISESSFIVPLLKAIQELSAEVDKLKNGGDA